VGGEETTQTRRTGETKGMVNNQALTNVETCHGTSLQKQMTFDK